MAEFPPFLLHALQFQDARKETLRLVSDSEWKRILSDWHVVRLTIPLREVCGDDLPAWVRERIDVFLTDNALRFERIKNVYSRAAKALEEAGTDHVVIKGFSLWPGYTDHPKYRPQSDIDIYCPPETVCRARDAIIALGYTTQPHWSKVSTEHLWALSPRDPWTWRGNHFDPDIPISFELHFSWWDGVNSRIHPQGVEEFWSRRWKKALDAISFPTLEPVDNLGYTALNLLRNLLNNLPATDQVYGLARFLHIHANDRPFWQRWRELHHNSLRRLEAVAFRLASEWFACRLSEEVEEEVDNLAPAIRQYFSHFAKSTFSTRFNTTKDGLWLHMDLLESRNDKLGILLQRIIPVRARKIPPLGRGEATAEDPTGKNLLSASESGNRWSVQYIKWFVTRSLFHFAIFPLTMWRGLGYRLSRKYLSRQFWTGLFVLL
jgi:hypothetical protein